MCMSCTDKCVRARAKVPTLIVNPKKKNACVLDVSFGKSHAVVFFFTFRSLTGPDINATISTHVRAKRPSFTNKIYARENARVSKTISHLPLVVLI